MSPSPPHTSLRKVINPSNEELEEIVKVMMKGFENEPFADYFSRSESAHHTPEEISRANVMTWLGPALVHGEVWIATRSDDRGIIGVGIWTISGRTLSDTPEGERYTKEYNLLLSPEQIQWNREVRSKVSSERKIQYPTLWRDTFHLHILVTIPESRGMGVGGTIMREMLKRAESQEAGLSLSTNKESNRLFYQKHGFSTIWERDLVYPDGSIQPYIVMAREAGAGSLGS